MLYNYVDIILIWFYKSLFGIWIWIWIWFIVIGH